MRFRHWVAWGTVMFLAVGIALYALSYLLFRERMFPPQLAQSFRARPWGIYPHALFGAIALLLGPLQFRRGILMRHRAVHRLLGRVFVVSSLFAGTAGLYMAFYAFGGIATQLGFGMLAVLLLTMTVAAYRSIRRGDVTAHREWMLRSYALIFAAVMLRLELPLLIIYFHSFTPAYRIVSWLCWVPNLLWAELFVRVTSYVAPALQPARAD